jgi:hypothetical protein
MSQSKFTGAIAKPVKNGCVKNERPNDRNYYSKDLEKFQTFLGSLLEP